MLQPILKKLDYKFMIQLRKPTHRNFAILAPKAITKVYKFVWFPILLPISFKCYQQVVWQCSDMWWGYESSAACEWVSCEAVEGSRRAGNSLFLCFDVGIMIYMATMSFAFVCVIVMVYRAVWRGVWRAYAYVGSVWETSAVTRGLGLAGLSCLSHEWLMYMWHVCLQCVLCGCVLSQVVWQCSYVWLVIWEQRGMRMGDLRSRGRLETRR